MTIELKDLDLNGQGFEVVKGGFSYGMGSNDFDVYFPDCIFSLSDGKTTMDNILIQPAVDVRDHEVLSLDTPDSMSDIVFYPVDDTHIQNYNETEEYEVTPSFIKMFFDEDYDSNGDCYRLKEEVQEIIKKQIQDAYDEEKGGSQ